jgi:hypothetical protein
MAKSKPVIEVNQSLSKSSASPSPHQQMSARIGGLEKLTTAVLWLGLITLFGIFVAVTTLVIDQEHYNNQTYREQTTNLQTQIQALQDEINSLKSK